MGLMHEPEVATVPGRSDAAAAATAEARHGAYILRSAYQPIYSLSHKRLIGHEALVRASDAGGKAVAPPALFEACTSAHEVRELDGACRALHARGFACGLEGAQWLFLNVDASVFELASPVRPADALGQTIAAAGLVPQQVVVELLEGALPEGAEFESMTRALKDQGYLLALDDFGAGHSNFDRVFRLQPHIVKLDRGVIARAGQDRAVRRVTTQMISLLHECGALVLVEGVESAHEAAIALDSDADLVQGYHFGRPAPVMSTPDAGNQALMEVWDRCDARARHERLAYGERIGPYARALEEARRLLEAGQAPEVACAAFLALDDAELCYFLDAQGEQVGRNLYGAGRIPAAALNQFAPLADPQGARWSRRPYFRRAMAAPGQLQVTRPYPTLQSHRICITMSISFAVGGKTLIVCGDMLWQSRASRPDFGTTSADAIL